MKILFVSRAYPPITGGIENQNFGIATSLAKIADITIFANHGGKKTLWWFLPYAFLRILFSFWKYDVILLGDGSLAPLGVPIRFLSFGHTRVAAIIHGLDITFFRKKGLLSAVYKFINIPALRNIDLLIAVGNQTREEALAIGVASDRCIFIPNGIFVQDLFQPQHTHEELARVINAHTDTPIDITNKKIILRIGRYVKHKGVEWFIRNVVPYLPDDTLFVAAGAVVHKKTAGDNDYYPRCVATIKELGLENKVRLLTNLPWNDMKVLFNTVDLAVSPNIPVRGSMEGFGINVIEAASCERVVVTSNLEGLKDAIIEGANGFLVEPENDDAFIEKITTLLQDDALRQTFGAKAREFTIHHFNWETIARQYLEALENISKK
ncbi:MAG: glycosyltransferase family 4 protein [Candidatus Moraniibacteriota bacterium]